jgi:coenzyme F420-reducing hydrogenase beta subunit
MVFCADNVGATKSKIAAAIRKEKIVFILFVFCVEKFEPDTKISLLSGQGKAGNEVGKKDMPPWPIPVM